MHAKPVQSVDYRGYKITKYLIEQGYARGGDSGEVPYEQWRITKVLTDGTEKEVGNAISLQQAKTIIDDLSQG